MYSTIRTQFVKLLQLCKILRSVELYGSPSSRVEKAKKFNNNFLLKLCY